MRAPSGGVPDGVADRGGDGHGADLAEADAAAGDVVPALGVEVHVDLRGVGDPGDAVVLQVRGEDGAGGRVLVALLEQGVADALDDPALALVARQPGSVDVAGRHAAPDAGRFDASEQGVHFDLGHDDGSGEAPSDGEVVEREGRHVSAPVPGALADDPEPFGLLKGAGAEDLAETARRVLGRRGDGRGGAAAGGRRPVGVVAVADLDAHLRGPQAERGPHDLGDHRAGAGADVLDGDAGDHGALLDRQRDLGAGVEEVHVVGGRDADAAAEAAVAGVRAVAPHGQLRGPVVQGVALGVAVPAAAQVDGVLAAAQRHLVHALLQRPQHRRQAGAAEGDAGGAVGDVVVVADPAGRVAVEEPRMPGRVRPDGHAGVAVGVHGEGGQAAAGVREKGQLDADPGAGAAVDELLRPAEDDPDRRAVQAGQLHGGGHVGGDVDLGAEAAAHVLGHDVDLLPAEVPALGRLFGDAGHRLGGQVEMQFTVFPAGHAAVRLHTGVGLHAGGEGGLHQGLAAVAPGLLDALHRRAAAPAHAGRAAHVAVPLGGRERALVGARSLLAGLRGRIDDGLVLRREHGGQHRVVDLDPRRGLQRLGLRGRGDRRHRLAHVADDAVRGQQLGQRTAEPDLPHLRVRVRRPYDHAFELPVQDDVRRVPRGTRDLAEGLHAGRRHRAVVVLPRARSRDRLVDADVRAAAAQVPGQGLGDLLAGRFGRAVLGAPPVHEGRRLHHEARRAVAALERVVLGEGPLHRMVAAEALDGRDLAVRHRLGGQQAARRRAPVHQDGAGAAHARAAGDLRPGQPHPLAQYVRHGLRGFGTGADGLAIEAEFHSRSMRRGLISVIVAQRTG